jgi:flagellin
MSLTINTNVNSLFAQTAITNNNASQTQAMQQLSTGLQINQASDNAAGLAVSQSMTEQINGLGQSIQNANDGINMLQTADSAMSTQQQMLQTMFTLATQASNGTYSSNQRSYMNTEFTQLSKQISNIASQTTWNGMTLLTGTKASGTGGGIGTNASGTVLFQVGATSGYTISTKISSMTASGLGVNSLSVSTVADASSALKTIDTALTGINSQRSTVGAAVNQLTYAAQDMTDVQQNITTSRSAITDTNYAQASTNLSRSQIIAQAATAMLAQANQASQNVLTLLK